MCVMCVSMEANFVHIVTLIVAVGMSEYSPCKETCLISIHFHSESCDVTELSNLHSWIHRAKSHS